MELDLRSVYHQDGWDDLVKRGTVTCLVIVPAVVVVVGVMGPVFAPFPLLLSLRCFLLDFCEEPHRQMNFPNNSECCSPRSSKFCPSVNKEQGDQPNLDGSCAHHAATFYFHHRR
jgi:hypothetical protein